MKRELHTVILPSDGNERNKLSLAVYDIIGAEGDVVGVGYSIRTEVKGELYWLNVHPAEVDELIRMLMDGKLVGRERLRELKELKSR